MDTGYSGMAIFISDYACLNRKQFIERQNYGEFEFWLALCKVIAILAFIALGATAISGFIRMLR